MKHIEDLKYMLCSELDRIASKGELTSSNLDTIDKLTHSIKSIDTIMAMEEYSEDGYYDGKSYERGSSYARGRGRNARRDSRGRYSNNYSREDGYSGHGDLKEELAELMEDADEKERIAIKKVLEMME